MFHFLILSNARKERNVPIYEYQCKSCDETFEVFLNSSDKPVKKCPSCNSSKIQKLISNCSFQLKGTGWYATDYANKDKKSVGKSKKKESDTGATETSSKPESGESASASESTPDKKPASTSENKAA
jgi:putative FmdB family regulatory protein